MTDRPDDLRRLASYTTVVLDDLSSGGARHHRARWLERVMHTLETNGVLAALAFVRSEARRAREHQVASRKRPAP